MENQVHNHHETMFHLGNTEIGAREAKRQGFCPNHPTQEAEHQSHALGWFLTAQTPAPQQEWWEQPPGAKE